MKRKIIKQSGRAYTITLPVKWIREINIREGDELNITQLNDELLVSAHAHKKEKKIIKLDVPEGRESAIRTIIVNAYRSGFDIIEVVFKGKKQILTNTVDTFLIGFELFEKSKNQFIIETVSEPSYENFENMVNRMIYLLQEIFEILPEENIDNLVYKVQKYDNFLKRCISKELFSIGGATFLWQFLSNLTQIARLAYHFKKSLLKNKKTFDKKVKEIYVMLNEMLELLKKGYLKKDFNVLSELHSFDQKINENAEKLIMQNPLIVHPILTIARMIYLANSPLTGYLHMHSFKK
ncbi:AbrB/MazE/SpoVT family DNA-binding domain-containing protein [Candidatus Woesearchaeota archaeon]|nr:AbrB/MazE/SpoVT family DNA-binding domain-containing protein [Candidatus Woesearchaeota archaeon]MBT6518436.1 AbrB/MazE/SpoVT family DNA-binding domain-containing protein [Candidatus Woesearchaeota archaeon]